jgi:hypothetical protein
MIKSDLVTCTPDILFYDQVLTNLRALPEEFNEAIKLDHQLQLLEAAGKLDLMLLISMRSKIERAIETGEREIRLVEKMVEKLAGLPALPHRYHAPMGF